MITDRVCEIETVHVSACTGNAAPDDAAFCNSSSILNAEFCSNNNLKGQGAGLNHDCDAAACHQTLARQDAAGSASDSGSECGGDEAEGVEALYRSPQQRRLVYSCWGDAGSGDCPPNTGGNGGGRNETPGPPQFDWAAADATALSEDLWAAAAAAADAPQPEGAAADMDVVLESLAGGWGAAAEEELEEWLAGPPL
jgi:hypothetical protein